VPLNRPATSGPFSGSGQRLDGKAAKARTMSTSSVSGLVETPTTGRPTCVEDLPPVVPDENYKPGALEFIRYNYKNLSELKRDLSSTPVEQPKAKFYKM
jgi:hypothetical protein